MIRKIGCRFSEEIVRQPKILDRDPIRLDRIVV